MVGKFTSVPLWNVWKHEALDFTVWLEENIEIMSDVLDLNLSNAEREKTAGTFSLDVFQKGAPVNCGPNSCVFLDLLRTHDKRSKIPTTRLPVKPHSSF